MGLVGLFAGRRSAHLYPLQGCKWEAGLLGRVTLPWQGPLSMPEAWCLPLGALLVTRCNLLSTIDSVLRLALYSSAEWLSHVLNPLALARYVRALTLLRFRGLTYGASRGRMALCGAC